jgi:hypothetical protein
LGKNYFHNNSIMVLAKRIKPGITRKYEINGKQQANLDTE